MRTGWVADDRRAVEDSVVAISPAVELPVRGLAAVFVLLSLECCFALAEGVYKSSCWEDIASPTIISQP